MAYPLLDVKYLTFNFMTPLAQRKYLAKDLSFFANRAYHFVIYLISMPKLGKKLYEL